MGDESEEWEAGWGEGASHVSLTAEVGEGTRIWHQAQVRDGARIGRDCIIGKGVYIDAGVEIGDRCKIENYACVYAKAVLCDGVFVGPGAILCNDKYPRAVNPDETLKGAGDWQGEDVLVKQGASIGAGAIILPGVTIGEWAMVGAGAVVTRDVPAYALMEGNPARYQGYACPCGQTVRRPPPDPASYFHQYRLVCPTCGHTWTVERSL